MNERIRELAGRVVGKNKNDVGSISLFDEQIEKFAKLILNDCCAIISNGSEFADRDRLVEKINEHFGVE